MITVGKEIKNKVIFYNKILIDKLWMCLFGLNYITLKVCCDKFDYLKSNFIGIFLRLLRLKILYVTNLPWYSNIIYLYDFYTT